MSTKSVLRRGCSKEPSKWTSVVFSGRRMKYLNVLNLLHWEMTVLLKCCLRRSRCRSIYK